MKQQSMSRRFHREAAAIVGFFCFALVVELKAMPLPPEGEQAAAVFEEARTLQEPRFRLTSPPAQHQGTENGGSGRTEADFTWQALTGNGAASGAGPMVGDASGKSYYDFRDELEHPYFILKLPGSH